MAVPTFVSRHIGVFHIQLCFPIRGFKRHRKDRLHPMSRFRNPCVLNLARLVENNETSIMGDLTSFDLIHTVEKAIDLRWVEDHLRNSKPRASRAALI